MKGKVVLITGATNGIGLETARALAKMSAKIVIVGRNPEKTERVVDHLMHDTGNEHIEGLLADLSVQAEIFKLAETFQQKYNRLDILINNAGGFFYQRELTPDGLEKTFALNHMSYFILTNQLLNILRDSAPARVINVSSHAHKMGDKRLDFDNLQSEKNFSSFRAYGQSKLANVMFTYALARRVEQHGITVNTLHPGFVNTGFGQKGGGLLAMGFSMLNKMFAMSPEKGARTTIYLASSPEVENVTGKYFANSKAEKSSSASYNVEDQEKLWDISESLILRSENA